MIDQESKELLFYIDATGENEGNWMKYIGCARYFEEQNIVSQQEGIDIYYRAIKVNTDTYCIYRSVKISLFYPT